MGGGSSAASSSHRKAARVPGRKRWPPDMAMKAGAAAVVLSFALRSFGGTSAQESTSPTPVLTPLDYLEIEQLVYRYGYALDTGADNGSGYADLYADDATFTGTNQGPSGV